MRDRLRVRLAREARRPPGRIDNSQAQLDTARRLQREHGLAFPLLHGNAEAVPYRDASFDTEVQVPDGSETRYPWITLEWAQRWPCEEVWKARKRR